MGRGLSRLQQYILTAAAANISTYEYTPPVYALYATLPAYETDSEAAPVAQALGINRTQEAIQRLLESFQPHCDHPLTPIVAREAEHRVFQWELPMREDRWAEAHATLTAASVLNWDFHTRYGFPVKVAVTFERQYQFASVLLATATTRAHAETLLEHFRHLAGQVPGLQIDLGIDSTPRKTTPYDELYRSLGTVVTQGGSYHLRVRLNKGTKTAIA